MSDAEATGTSTDTPASTATKNKASTLKKPRAKPFHPKTSDIAKAAMQDLIEHRGSPLQAIKKYLKACCHHGPDQQTVKPALEKVTKYSNVVFDFSPLKVIPNPISAIRGHHSMKDAWTLSSQKDLYTKD